MECRRIESLLPPYVDGEARATEIAEVERHLSTCASCRSAVTAQRTVRVVLKARGRDMASPLPPGLRTRLEAMVPPRVSSSLGWGGRLSAFAAAAALLVVVVGALELASPRSNVLYAAQLALDHVRCFVVELGSMASPGSDAAEVRDQFAQNYGWEVSVPASSGEVGLTLIAARRCPFWLGDHAHLLYRVGDRKVSLYVTPGTARARAELSVLGHAERIWTHGGQSYVLVARGLPAADLDRIAAYLERATRSE